jgi:hypothetical protein
MALLSPAPLLEAPVAQTPVARGSRVGASRGGRIRRQRDARRPPLGPVAGALRVTDLELHRIGWSARPGPKRVEVARSDSDMVLVASQGAPSAEGSLGRARWGRRREKAGERDSRRARLF